MIDAGVLQNRVRFERRSEQAADNYGNVQGAWGAVATVWAGFRPQFGREQLQAGKMESTLQGSLIVRKSDDTAAIKEDDRAVFVIGPYAGRVCQIRSIVPTMDNDGIEFLLEETST